MTDKKAFQAAIAYFEDAVQESDEIITDCSPDLQKELTEQKAHFDVALAVMRRAEPANEPLVRCGECTKYQSRYCAAKHEQALMDYCSHGVRNPEGGEL